MKELQRQRINEHEMSPVPVPPVEENAYDYVYEVPDATETAIPRSERVTRTPSRGQSSIR